MGDTILNDLLTIFNCQRPLWSNEETATSSAWKDIYLECWESIQESESDMWGSVCFHKPLISKRRSTTYESHMALPCFVDKCNHNPKFTFKSHATLFIGWLIIIKQRSNTVRAWCSAAVRMGGRLLFSTARVRVLPVSRSSHWLRRLCVAQVTTCCDSEHIMGIPNELNAVKQMVWKTTPRRG